MIHAKTASLAKIISKHRDLAVNKYLLADSTEIRVQAVVTLLNWLGDAETRDNFLLFLSGIDQNEIFSVPFMNLIVLLHESDPIKMKALEYNLIRRKM